MPMFRGLAGQIKPLTLALALAFSLPSLLVNAADRKRIEKESDIPSFSYTVADPLEKVVRDPVLFERFAGKVRTDFESVMEHYEFTDKAAARDRLLTLAQLDFLAGNYDAAMKHAMTIRDLEEKPADKLLSGLRLRAMITAAKEAGGINTPAYFEKVGQLIRAELDTMPFDVISNDIKSYKSSAERIGEGGIMGGVLNVLQPTLTKTGSLSSDLAPGVIGTRYALVSALPLKQTLIKTYTGYLDQHKVEKKDIWAARSVTLPASGKYSTVNMAIWDSGVDTSLFPGLLMKDAKGHTPLIAHDLYARRTVGELFPIPAAVQPKLPELLGRTKGFSDLTSNIDSPEASEVKQLMSNLKPEEFKPVVEQLGMVGNYSHGTHVAGIAVEGNPWARLAVARISFGYTLLPDPCPSPELAKRGARAYGEVVSFLRHNKVRVVNMSWGGSLKGVEEDLEKCGMGKTLAERQRLARMYFDMDKSALTKAFASAPEILFITSAGNSNVDATFGDFIPSSIVLPNLLTVGAVDKAGDEASFTSYGPTVHVHANGYQVESFLPGGKRVAFSGTSMSSPNVANLAAKLLAVKPSLKPEEVIKIIRETAEKTADGRRILINPAQALKKVQG